MDSVLPGRQERSQHLARHRLGFVPELRQRAPLQEPEHPRVAPLRRERARQVLTLDDPAVGREPVQRPGHDRDAQAVLVRHFEGGERAVRPGVPGDQVAERIRQRLGEGGGDAWRERDAERVTQPSRVLDRGKALLACDPYLDDPALGREVGDPGRRGLAVGAAVDDLSGRQRADLPDHVRELFGRRASAAGRQALQVPLRVRHDLRVEQLSQVGLTEQLGEECGIQGQRLGPALGQRRVAFVHECADVPEQERSGERRARLRLDLDQPDPASGEVAHEPDQRRDVEHVLQALAHRLEHDREAAVAAGYRQQLGRPLALLPERTAAARLAARKQERARRALTEPGREQRRRAEFGSHDLLDLVRIEHRETSRRRVVRIRNPDHDPVVGIHGLHVHAAVPLPQPGRDRQRPRRVHLRPERTVQDQPPVAEFVPEALEHEGPVIRQVAGRLALAGQVTEQVRRGQLIQSVVAQPRRRLAVVGGHELAAVLADRTAQFHGPPGRVTVPERQLAWLPGSRRDEDLVGRDVLDAPGARAEYEDVTDARFVDHLLVELADPP